MCSKSILEAGEVFFSMEWTSLAFQVDYLQHRGSPQWPCDRYVAATPFPSEASRSKIDNPRTLGSVRATPYFDLTTRGTANTTFTLP